ncbi:FHA domain-containing protein [Arthrobacter sp. STN4]|uniref:FHA domain-containing protein n=1 Tax=Arthrobacter sp. STN4 TaxID=2923276 RepID=UPI00211A2FA9|nr:FHA domain-containing protein [Arthrobacter sp. STN4]MCQ9163408.1 FHA domain-containing protein [Arthrobacter sp. STN4]
MPETTYRPGPWLGIVRSGAVIVLEAGTGPGTVAALWESLGRDTPTIDGVLNAVTSGFGTDLTGMPAFGILVAGDRLHAILRGGMTLSVQGGGTVETVSGRDVTTWSERSLALPESMVLTLDAVLPEPGATPGLPVGEAVVLLSELRRGMPAADVPSLAAGTGQAAAAPAPAHAAEGPAMEGLAAPASPAPGSGSGAAHGTAGDGGGDDVYAGFALAADAEWNAELDEPSRSEQDAHHPEASAAASPDAPPPENPAPENPAAVATDHGDVEEDLGRTIYPGLGHEDSAADEPAGDAGGPGAEAADVSNTTNYDHLFGATELRSVEDAAVRLDEDGREVHDAAPGPAPAVIPPQPQLPPSSGQPPAGEAPAAAPAPAWQPPSGLLIDSVPWGNSRAGGSPAGAPAAPGNVVDTDHDGHTVMRSEVAGNDAAGGPATTQLESRPPTGPMVLARLCPSGHANPPSRSQCSECGAAISSEPREVGRPRLGRMHISTGEVLDLDHSLVVGRQPSVSRVMGGVMPRLVQVHSSSGDISRSHVEVRLDGWDVLLVDLKATNGTVLVREGQAPRRLGQGEQAILLNGDIAELGDGVSLLFEGLL